MAAEDPKTVDAGEPEQAPGLPDYALDFDAVLKDKAAWRYGKAPDYSNTRRWYEETKTVTHEKGSLGDIVNNIVKNWEIEASFKTSLSDWRTVDPKVYTFAINGGPPQSAEHMLKVGTYNAIVAPNQYYSPEYEDFAASHKTFKRMMPTFAWEVIEVYSGPPTVAFKWRHWGIMKNDYSGVNDKGEQISIKAKGGKIEIFGVTVAQVNEVLQVQKLETWFDPLAMFRQIAQGGITEDAKESAVNGDAGTAPEPGDAAADDKTTQHDAAKDGESNDKTIDGNQTQDDRSKDSAPQEQEAISVSTNSSDAKDKDLKDKDAAGNEENASTGACPFGQGGQVSL